jgi:plasmid stabilization system protein ParE
MWSPAMARSANRLIQHIERAFAKAGANRQIDLIREIAWTAADGGKR